MNIGKAIETIRKDKGVSQRELAEQISISANALVNIEKGRSFPKKENILAICNALEISEAYLLLSCLEEEDIPEEKRILFRTMVVPLRNELKEDF